MVWSKNRSLLNLLFDREIGHTNKFNAQSLVDLGMLLSEIDFRHEMRIKDIRNFYDGVGSNLGLLNVNDEESDAEHNEEQQEGDEKEEEEQQNEEQEVSAVTAKHLAKVNLLNTSGHRGIWIMAYHPRIPSLLATGSVYGLVTIYQDYMLQATSGSGDDVQSRDVIESLCFHPLHDYVAYSNRSTMKIWDWKNDMILYSLSGKNIKYMRFSPLNNMLVTFQVYQEISSDNCVDNFFNIIAGVGLLLASNIEPSNMNDELKFINVKLLHMDNSCASDCNSQYILEISASFAPSRKYNLLCRSANFPIYSLQYVNSASGEYLSTFDHPENITGWQGMIAQSKYHTSTLIDVSQCGRKVVITVESYGPNRDNSSRLEVYSLEKSNLGQLLHNIQSASVCSLERYGAIAFSPSSNYLVLLIQNMLIANESVLGLHVLKGNQMIQVTSRYGFNIFGTVEFIKWSPYPNDRIIVC